MERQEFDRLEIEANGYNAHHLQGQLKAARVELLIKLVHKEAMEELEAGQNFGVGLGDYLPCNTNR
jgi:hypothetical protein